jgi:hypothetical protein
VMFLILPSFAPFASFAVNSNIFGRHEST